MSVSQKVLIISDGKPGHVNQARALCGIMGWEKAEAIVEYPIHLAKGATYLLDWLKIYTKKGFALKTEDGNRDLNRFSENPEKFQLVIAVGSASYYPAKVFAKKAGIPLIALMYPRGFRGDFDHILCPAYDNPPEKENITALPITLCSREEGFYDRATEDFSNQFAYQLPAVSVIIGGDNKYERLCPERIEKQLGEIFALTPDHQHWVTTSRRTSSEVEKVVKQFDFDYKLIYSKKQYNPIPAFLNLSEYLFVTSDSSSMISECVCMGKSKVEVLKNVTKRKSKFDKFLTELAQTGCIHIFDGRLEQADKKIDIGQEVRKALAKFQPTEAQK